jgi:putative ABC transport system permease protein
MPDFAWILKMALRDFRKNLSRLLLFVSSIVVGIAALVAISSFGENLVKDIDNQAKELLGADLVLENS